MEALPRVLVYWFGPRLGATNPNQDMITQETAVDAGITKVCGKCKIEKELIHFSFARRHKFNRGSYCRKCNVEKLRKWYVENREKIAASRIGWFERNKDKIVKRNAEWRAIDPNRQKAHNAVRREIRRGAIIKPTCCSKCNQPGRVEAHHDSYAPDRWLDVVFLCRSCHKRLHAENPHIMK